MKIKMLTATMIVSTFTSSAALAGSLPVAGSGNASVGVNSGVINANVGTAADAQGHINTAPNVDLDGSGSVNADAGNRTNRGHFYNDTNTDADINAKTTVDAGTAARSEEEERKYRYSHPKSLELKTGVNTKINANVTNGKPDATINSGTNTNISK